MCHIHIVCSRLSFIAFTVDFAHFHTVFVLKWNLNQYFLKNACVRFLISHCLSQFGTNWGLLTIWESACKTQFSLRLWLFVKVRLGVFQWHRLQRQWYFCSFLWEGYVCSNLLSSLNLVTFIELFWADARDPVFTLETGFTPTMLMKFRWEN